MVSFGFIFGSPFLNGQDREQCLIVLDASNSMSGYKKGTQKMRIAKQVIGDLVATMPDNIDLGLVVYGHRKKSDCEDIELMIPPGPLNQGAFMQTVSAIRANGKTPLTNSIEFATEALISSGGGGSIILLTDGLETCRRDPCEAVAALVASGIQLTTHVVAFDLSAKQAQEIKCIADQTGGQLLEADDATSLLSALNTAITMVAAGSPSASGDSPGGSSSGLASMPPQTAVAVPEPQPAPVEEAVVEEFPITLTVPESVAAGSDFLVGWEGPSKAGDVITIVAKDWEEGRWKNYSRVGQDNPLWLTALIDPQEAEVRYLSGETRNTLGRADILITPTEATLSGPSEAVQGNTVKVEWTGPAHEGDFITIVPKDADPGTWKAFTYATQENHPILEVKGLPEPGPAEIRYLTGQERRTLARADINFVEALVSLSAAEDAIAGSSVKVTWEGPANDGDFITIVPASAEEGKYLKYAYAKSGENTVKITAPIKPGDAEIRYLAGNGRATLARIPIRILEAEVTLAAPGEAVAGSEVPIQWEGPANSGDFITIVAASAPEGSYKKYAYARPDETAIKVTAPMETGPAEIRYLAGNGRKTLARIPIEIKKAEVSLSAPEEAVAGSLVKVEWEGPGNSGDFLTIVSKLAPEKSYSKVTYTKSAHSVVDVPVPMDIGESEIRYVAGAGRQTLARIPILVKAAEISLKAPEEATVGNTIRIEWEGPANKGDFITLVNKSAAERYYQKVAYVVRGKPVVEILAPMEPGDMEIRYLAGANRETLGRVDLKLMEADIQIHPPDEAMTNQRISIRWAGPQNQNDFLVIVPAGSPDRQNGPSAYTAQGSPASLLTPREAGNYEIRYISGQDRRVLGSAPIKINAPEQ